MFGISALTLSFIVSPASAYVDVALDSTIKINDKVTDVVDTTVSTDIETDLSTTADSNESSELDLSTQGDVKLDLGSTQNETSTKLQLNSSGIAVVSSSQVSSEEDFEVFASNAVQANKAVARVKSDSENSGEVKVVYKHKGKLLGFIPVKIKSTTAVKAEENADVYARSNLSWWSFLVIGENYNRTDIESRIQSNTRIQANAKLDISARTKAEIAESIIAELQASAGAQANATAK